MRNSLIRYLRNHPGLLLMGVVVITITALTLTLIPAEYLSQTKLFSYDKLGHIFLFGSWTYLLGLYRMIQNYGKTNLWKVFSLGVLFGGLIEVIQFLMPLHRHGDIIDLSADALGALCAILVLKYLFPASGRSDL